MNTTYALVALGIPKGGLAVRALHVALDTGQLAAAGIVSAAAMGLVRPVPRGSRLRHVMLFVVAGVVSLIVLPEDLVGLTGNARAWSVLGCLLVAAVIPVGATTAQILARRSWVLPLASGLGLQVLNNLVYTRAYIGLHFFLLWTAALFAGAGIERSPLPERIGWRSPRWMRHAVVAALCLGASLGVAHRPPVEALLEMYKTPGAALAPFVARAHFALEPGVSGEGEWFADRSRLPPTPPTEPPVISGTPIVILVSVDAFRHDLLRSGSASAQFAALSAMMDDGVDFADAKAPSPATVPSLAAVFTGRFYSQLYWTEQTGAGNQKLWPHNDEHPRLAALLSAAGVRTVMVMSGTGFAPRFGLTDKFDEYLDKGAHTGIPAARITDHIVSRLERHDGGPLFVYTHYFEPHAPYDRAGKEGTPLERYRREVALVDAEMGKLVAAIERLGLRDRALLIVTGDHGEAFGEHGTNGHGVSLYEEIVHVPLLVWGAGLSPRRVDETVSLADLGPTILDVFGQPTPPTFLGQSLVPLLRGEPATLTRPVVAESGRHVRAMYFRDGYKLIVDSRMGTVELYDLSRDKGELENLSASRPDVTEDRMRLLRAYFSAHAYRREGYTLPYRP